MNGRTDGSMSDLMTPGMRLMLLSCVSECTAGQLAEMRKLAMDFEQWDYFLRLVLKNRVFPSVFRSLSRLDGIVDEKMLRLLQVRCEQNNLSVVKLMAELIRIARRFDREKVRMISLKGPALGLALYGDLSLRTSKDLDLLVSPKDVDAAEQILISMGYAGCGQTNGFTPRQRRYLLKKGHHFSYVNGDGVEVELHWRYDDDYSVGFDDVWMGRKSVTAFGERIDLLENEENFLFLLHHGTKHGWKRLRWLLDMREITLRGEIDWPSLCQKARARGMTSMLDQAFVLLKNLFGLELPAGLKGLEMGQPEALRQAQRSAALIASADDLCGMPNHEHYLTFKEYLIGLRRMPLDRLRFFLTLFHPGEIEFQAVRIPDRFFWLYYFFRPVWKLKRLICREEISPNGERKPKAAAARGSSEKLGTGA